MISLRESGCLNCPAWLNDGRSSKLADNHFTVNKIVPYSVYKSRLVIQGVRFLRRMYYTKRSSFGLFGKIYKYKDWLEARYRQTRIEIAFWGIRRLKRRRLHVCLQGERGNYWKNFLRELTIHLLYRVCERRRIVNGAINSEVILVFARAFHT